MGCRSIAERHRGAGLGFQRPNGGAGLPLLAARIALVVAMVRVPAPAGSSCGSLSGSERAATLEPDCSPRSSRPGIPETVSTVRDPPPQRSASFDPPRPPVDHIMRGVFTHPGSKLAVPTLPGERPVGPNSDIVADANLKVRWPIATTVLS